jgi:hypothetical protein
MGELDALHAAFPADPDHQYHTQGRFPYQYGTVWCAAYLMLAHTHTHTNIHTHIEMVVLERLGLEDMLDADPHQGVQMFAWRLHATRCTNPMAINVAQPAERLPVCLTQRHVSRRPQLARQPSCETGAALTSDRSRPSADKSGRHDESGNDKRDPTEYMASSGDRPDKVSPADGDEAYQGESGTQYTQTQPQPRESESNKRLRPYSPQAPPRSKTRNPFGVLLLGQTPTAPQKPSQDKPAAAQRLKQFAYVPGVSLAR